MALARYEGTAVNTAGDVIPNATVEVRRDQPGRPVVPLWADRDGTVALGNPIQTDAQGAFAFHVLGGVYYIRIFTGPSQQPTFQKVLRYVAIGTAAERDIEDLASALEAGTAAFPTLAELEAFVPEVAGVGGKVTTGADAGFYHYDDVAEEWVFDRYLYDTMARMNVTGGTADAIEAEIVPGVPDAAVVMLWIEAPATNTGAVTINGTPILNSNEEDLTAGQWVEGRTYWFSDEGAFYKLRTDSDVSDLVAQAEAAASAAAQDREDAETASAAAIAAAAGLNLPSIEPGDSGKQLFVNAAEDGYDLDEPPEPITDGDKGDIVVSGTGSVWLSKVKAQPQGRLTLTAGVAFPASDVAGATNVYYLPVLGESAPIYDGANFLAMNFGVGLTLALNSDSGHSGYHQSGRNFDLFIFNDGGTARLGSGPSWNAGAVAGSDTARGTGAGSTELEQFGGLLVNKNAITLRWGAASGNTLAVNAREATYVGSFRTTADGQASDTAQKRLVFNAYNQMARKLFVSDPVESYNYANGTYRQFNGNSNNKVELLLGLSGILATAIVQAYVSTTDGTPRVSSAAVGLDTTTLAASDDVMTASVAAGSVAQTVMARYCGYPGIGFHYLAPLEAGTGAATNQRWFGNNAGAYTVRPGLSGEVTL